MQLGLNTDTIWPWQGRASYTLPLRTRKSRYIPLLEQPALEWFMFERYNDQARVAIVFCVEEARRLKHNYVGPEHLLLGVIHDRDCAGAKVLDSLGISLEAVRQQVKEIISEGERASDGHINFTPRAKEVLVLAMREALVLEHKNIGTEHLLLGLIRELLAGVVVGRRLARHDYVEHDVGQGGSVCRGEAEGHRVSARGAPGHDPHLLLAFAGRGNPEPA
jgi:Clp amino terminal domain, pathogenicity island component